MDQLHLKCTHFRREEGHGQEHQFLTQKGPSVDTGCVAYSVDGPGCGLLSLLCSRSCCLGTSVGRPAADTVHAKHLEQCLVPRHTEENGSC